MSARGRTIPIARPFLGEEEADAARRAILSGWITQGPEVAAFEEEFAAYVGARHACAVSSCTTALHLTLHSLGLRPGDEVVTVSHSYIATVNAVQHCGARPVFVDIDPGTFNLDPGHLEAAITPRTRAILPVHQMGLPCDLPSILEIARRHGLPVIEDAACAIGSRIRIGDRWDRIGRPHGLAACFSFHPRKLLTTGDGGMIVTNDQELDATVRRLRQHAMSIPDTVRHAARSVLFETYPAVGFNYRMTDIQAAIGRVQLTKVPGMLQRRLALATRYQKALVAIPGLQVPKTDTAVQPNYQSYPVRVTAEFPMGRDALMQALLERGVSTRRGIMNAHQEPAYASTEHLPLPHSEAARDHVILLPMYDGLTSDDQEYIIAILRHIAAGKECPT